MPPQSTARIRDIIHAINTSQPLSQTQTSSQTSSESMRSRPEFVIPLDPFPASPLQVPADEIAENAEVTHDDSNGSTSEVEMGGRPTQSSGGRKRAAQDLDSMESSTATAQDGPSIKRRRGAENLERAPEPVEQGTRQTSPVENANPDEDDALESALQKQREEQVKSQQSHDKDDNTTTKLSKMQCVICMDSFTDMTTTSCGHLFCHECLISALKASETRRFQATGHNGKKSQCPVCRKQLSRTNKNDVIPLLLLKGGLATQPRRART